MGTGIICGNEACGMELDPDPPSGRRPGPACGSMARTETVPVVHEAAPVLEQPPGRETDKIYEGSFSVNDEKAESAEPLEKPRRRASAKKKPAAKKKPTLKKKPAKKKAPAK